MSKNKKSKQMDKLMKRIAKKEERAKKREKERKKYGDWMGSEKGKPFNRGKKFYSK